MKSAQSLVILLLLALPLAGGETPKETAEAKKIASLIAQLGAKTFAEREQASKALQAIGEPALPQLRNAAFLDKDAEIQHRAKVLADDIAESVRMKDQFASRLLAAVKHIHENYVLEIDTGELAAYAVRGMYRELKAELPKDLENDLAKARGAKDADLAALLRRARGVLASRPGLEGDQDARLAVHALMPRLDPHSQYLDAMEGMRPLVHAQPDRCRGVRRNGEGGWDYWLDRDRKIAYVGVPIFSAGTTATVRDVLASLRKDGLKALILDLRFNPGGLLKESVELVDLFIDDGLILRIVPRHGKEMSWSGNKEGSLLDFPIVCLVNGDTASGAEIVAACLQDHKRATILGERTRGKGSVQNITSIPELPGQLKLTVALFHRPSGKKLDRLVVKGREEDEWGVVPEKDFLVSLKEKEREKLREHLPAGAGKGKDDDFQDRQLERALEHLRQRLKKR